MAAYASCLPVSIESGHRRNVGEALSISDRQPRVIAAVDGLRSGQLPEVRFERSLCGCDAARAGYVGSNQRRHHQAEPLPRLSTAVLQLC
jgi:hypothetical protein